MKKNNTKGTVFLKGWKIKFKYNLFEILMYIKEKKDSLKNQEIMIKLLNILLELIQENMLLLENI